MLTINNLMIKLMEYLTQIIRVIKIFTFIFVLSPILELNAKVYKWVDENGKVHFSDQPIDEKSKAMKMNRQPTPQEIKQAKKRANSLIRHKNKVNDIIEETNNDKRYAQQKSEEAQKKQLQNCGYAKDQARTLSQGRLSYTIDEKGERHFLSDAEKEDMIAEINKFVKESC